MTDTAIASVVDMPIENRPVTEGHEIGEGVMQGPYKPLSEQELGDAHTTHDEKMAAQGINQLTEHERAANDALRDGHITGEAHYKLHEERTVALNGLSTSVNNSSSKASVNNI